MAFTGTNHESRPSLSQKPMETVTTEPQRVDVVVAGHICIDIIPTFQVSPAQAAGRHLRLEELLTPGKLVNVGPAVISTGGSVSNTGLALHRLGVSVRLVGKLGEDQFGQMVLQFLARYDPALTQGMVVARQEQSSYTFVINPPGLDRIFLHCPGANDTFGEADITPDHLKDARLFHFGYPPLMRQMYLDQGSQLKKLFRKVKRAGLVTSLDMARPDPDSEAGRVDWARLLERVLPWVDLFQPSLDETLFMLDRLAFERLQKAAETETRPGGWLAGLDAGCLSDLAARLVGMGAAVVALKLGDQGLYVRTTTDRARLKSLSLRLGLDPENWLGRECLAPCFKANVVGTTGAGDCTIAGFLTGALSGLSLEQVMTGAVATGACNVEAADATSGVPAWTAVQQRIQAGWERLPVYLSMEGWRYDSIQGMWFGPQDHRQSGA
jgi:sugar/nucleoside kinase (ribokinase family)